MPAATMNFDWLLDHATAIAFDPERPSIYVFALDMPQEEFQGQVLEPMAQQGLFAAAQTQFIDASRRDRYRGQLPRVALNLFEVSGRQCGVVLTYHSKFEPRLEQYDAWTHFWHQRLLDEARSKAQQ
jgi:hypothetical protein